MKFKFTSSYRNINLNDINKISSKHDDIRQDLSSFVYEFHKAIYDLKQVEKYLKKLERENKDLNYEINKLRHQISKKVFK